MRVFLDTNVLVSAFASRGLCAEVLELVLLEHDFIVGRSVLRELYKALREKVKLPAVQATDIVDFVSNEAMTVVEDVVTRPIADVDAADARVLAEALLGQAEAFVTGDAALLRLSALDALAIVSPRQFWEILRSLPQR